MKNHRPHGPKPTKLEADILKMRAFEMVLILFYMEDLKSFIIGTLESAHIFRNTAPLLPEKKKMEAARRILVEEECISQAESDQIKKLLEYRNIIGHEIDELTFDIGAYSELGKFDPETFEPILMYDYTAVKNAANLREKVSNGMAKKFATVVSLNGLRFGAAEKVYLAEIKRLKSHINKGIKEFNDTIATTNNILKKIPRSVFDIAQPGHPRNIRINGNLSEKGKICAFQLFQAGATPLAVSYLMRISYQTSCNWYKKWKLVAIEK